MHSYLYPLLATSILMFPPSLPYPLLFILCAHNWYIAKKETQEMEGEEKKGQVL